MKLFAIRFVLLLIVVLSSQICHTQEIDTAAVITDTLKAAAAVDPADNAGFDDPNDSGTTVTLPTSVRSYHLSLFILAFGILLIICEMILVRHSRICAEDTIKFVVITIIIISTLFLITAGYSNNQIAPAIGLLGTITGYLLGKINPSNTKE